MGKKGDLELRMINLEHIWINFSIKLKLVYVQDEYKNWESLYKRSLAN